MAQRVVDIFEAIQVQYQHAAGLRGPFCDHQRLREPVVKHRAVRQTGQLILECQPKVLFFSRRDTREHVIEARRQGADFALLHHVHVLSVVTALNAARHCGKLVNRPRNIAGDQDTTDY